MPTINPKPPKIELDFTDARLTGQGGWALLAPAAQTLGLLERLDEAIDIKQRDRGTSDGEMLWSLIASLSAGNGALSDVDALRADAVGCRLLGLRRAPSSRRLGEYLSRFGTGEMDALQALVRALTHRFVPAVIEHEVERFGYVPVFVDGSAIKVDGRRSTGRGYDGAVQYWLHSVFVGGLWASGRLHPGGVDVARGWREQLERDMAPMLTGSAPAWVRMDNAYYKGEFVRHCAKRGWDYSVSVTHSVYRRPILELVESLDAETAWRDIGLGESATTVRYFPGGWKTQTYVVVRRLHDGPQRRLAPAHTVILVSRDDLDVAELVRRHRGKQGQENAFKGPLIDLDPHHPPCRRFRANQAFHACGQIAQLLLRTVQYQLLPVAARRHGLRPLIRLLIRSVARLVHTGRRWRLDFAKSNFRLDWLLHAAWQLE